MPQYHQIDDSDDEEERPRSVDSELKEFDSRVPATLFPMLFITPKGWPDGKPRDRLLKFECKTSNKTLMN